jgi:hypothetical protein
MVNKRGQGLSTNAIILIILGIIVLVILILGFTIGWNRLLPFVQSNNVDNIKTTCSIACSTNNDFDFCSQNRTLKADGLPGGEVTSNCNVFATDVAYDIYGIDPCPGLC